MEYWDLYDIARNKTGKTAVRGEKIADGDYHLIIHICIFNSEGQMLIQRRQSFKDGWPDLWDITVGGSAVKGDSSQTAAERELREELGIKADFKGVRPHLTINAGDCFDDVYLIEKDVSLSDLKLQYEEVQDAKWASEAAIISMIDSGEFIPYYPDAIRLFFDIRKHYGFHQQKQ